MRFAPLFTLLLLLGVTATAHARLGETADQLVARYGQPLSENDQKASGDKIALSEVIFQKGGIRIYVTITEGVSVAEIYHKLNGDPFTFSEATILLNANSQGSSWEAPQDINGEKLWTRDDRATALLAKDGSLTIKSRELTAKEAIAKKEAVHPTLEGF
jgi:hypothetical protein